MTKNGPPCRRAKRCNAKKPNERVAGRLPRNQRPVFGMGVMKDVEMNV